MADKNPDEEENIKFIDDEKGENLDFRDEDEQNRFNDVIKEIKSIPYPTDYDSFMRRLGIENQEENKDDEIIRKIIDRGLKFCFYLSNDNSTVKRSTRGPDGNDGREIISITLLSEYLSWLKDLAMFYEDHQAVHLPIGDDKKKALAEMSKIEIKLIKLLNLDINRIILIKSIE